MFFKKSHSKQCINKKLELYSLNFFILVFGKVNFPSNIGTNFNAHTSKAIFCLYYFILVILNTYI